MALDLCEMVEKHVGFKARGRNEVNGALRRAALQGRIWLRTMLEEYIDRARGQEFLQKKKYVDDDIKFGLAD